MTGVARMNFIGTKIASAIISRSRSIMNSMGGG
jgi:hypothetical protein